MRIAVLAYNLVVAGGLSVGKNITALLPKAGPEHTYLMFVPKGAGYETHGGQENVTVNEISRMGFFERARFELLLLPKQIKDFAPKVILGLGNMGLQRPPCKQAVLFQQSQLLYESKHYGRMELVAQCKMWAIRQWVKRYIKHTDLIFCQTPVAAEKFSRTFNYPLEQIKVMPNAVSEFSKIDRAGAALPEVFRTKGSFNLFYLTKFYAHKNLEVLIDIFRRYSDRLKNVRCIVTISAEQHKNAPKFLSDINKYNLEKYIVNVGPLEQEELAGYFHNVDALLFPTLLESFSTTYLEAMHFGTPILTSDLDFAHYICGQTAVYFDPWDPSDIVEKIFVLRDNHKLRNELAMKGKERLCSFFKTWEEITADVIRELESLVNSESAGV